METKIKQLEQYIQNAQRIVITSHISPDPDAVCSVLLLGTTLNENFPDKQIRMVLDEQPDRSLSFLEGYDSIKFCGLFAEVKAFQPDLFIIADAMNYERISRSEGRQLRSLNTKLQAKLVIIDHHTDTGLEECDLYINNQRPATVQEIYDILFNQLSLKKPKGYAQTTLLGIVSDTARFKYDSPHHRETFNIVSDLLDVGTSIELLENSLDRYSSAQMQILSNLANNISDSGKGYTFSFIDDSVDAAVDELREAIQSAGATFTNQFLRNFESNQWGFVVYPEVINGQKSYSVSFRAVNGVKDVAAIAAKLGGGGHKSASGAKGIMASDAESAVKFVQSVIKNEL